MSKGFSTMHPVRVILFTSPTCGPCVSVDRIIRKFLGPGFGISTHYNKIDVDEERELVEKYDIKRLPTLLINDEKITSELIDEITIAEKLQTKLFETVIEREKLREIHKENLLILTQNTLGSMNQERIIRPNIGDYCHIGILQQNMLSILALDPLAEQFMYITGKDLGIFGAGHTLLITANPQIYEKLSLSDRFKEIIKGFQKIYSSDSPFPLFIAENTEIISNEDETAKIRIYGLATSVGAPDIGEHLCPFIAGEIAGITQALLGKTTFVEEIACWGTGHEYCEFAIDISDEAENKKYETPPPIPERRDLFRLLIKTIADRFNASVLMKDVQRPTIGDYVYMGLLQQPITSAKIMDEFCGSILYSAGRELGNFGPGKEILRKSMEKRNVEKPLDFQTGVLVLNDYLTHPIMHIARVHAFCEIIELSEEESTIRIHDCAYATGVPGLGKTFCDFQAGYMAGRLEILTNIDTTLVTETKCHGTGVPYCEFLIEKD